MASMRGGIVGTIISALVVSIVFVTNAVEAETHQNNGVPSNTRNIVREAWQVINEHYFDSTFGGTDWNQVGEEFLGREYDTIEAAHLAIHDMLSYLNNPSTRFLTSTQAKALIAEVGGELSSGVGLMELLSIDVEEASGDVVIITPVANTPAARAGLRTGDKLLTVDLVPVKELDLASVMSALRGPEGSVVNSTVQRQGKARDVSIIREQLPPIDAVDARILNVQSKDIMYLGLTLFTGAAAEEVLAQVARISSLKVDAVVLDLRNNPGGRLSALQTVAGAFLGSVPLAKIRDRGGIRTLVATGKLLTDSPLVVLMNEGTASAAEVLASALRYHKRANIVGARSYGKGLVHDYVELPDGSGIMYTAGRIKTLNGIDILTSGVAPDTIVEFDPHPVVDAKILVASAQDLEFLAAIKSLSRKSH